MNILSILFIFLCNIYLTYSVKKIQLTKKQYINTYISKYINTLSCRCRNNKLNKCFYLSSPYYYTFLEATETEMYVNH